MRYREPVFHGPRSSFHPFIPLETIWNTPFLERFNITKDSVPLAICQKHPRQTYMMEFTAGQSWLRFENAILFVIECIQQRHTTITMRMDPDTFPRPSRYCYLADHSDPDLVKRRVIRSRDAFLPWLAWVSALYADLGGDAVETALRHSKVAPAWIDDLFATVGNMSQKRIGCYVRFNDYRPDGLYEKSNHNIDHKFLSALLRTNAPIHLCWGLYHNPPDASKQMQLGAQGIYANNMIHIDNFGPLCKWKPRVQDVQELKSKQPLLKVDSDKDVDMTATEDPSSYEPDVESSDTNQACTPHFNPAKDSTADTVEYSTPPTGGFIAPNPDSARTSGFQSSLDVLKYRFGLNEMGYESSASDPSWTKRLRFTLQDMRDPDGDESFRKVTHNFIQAIEESEDVFSYYDWDTDMNRYGNQVTSLQKKCESISYTILHHEQRAPSSSVFRFSIPVYLHSFLLCAKDVEFMIILSDRERGEINYPHHLVTPLQVEEATLRQARTSSRACSVAHILRAASTLSEVELLLLQHRIPFQVAFPGHARSSPSKDVIGVGRREIRDTPGRDDYAQYTSRLRRFFQMNPDIHRIALAYGGVVAYIANLYESPPFPMKRPRSGAYVKSVNIKQLQLHYQDLSPQDLALICGVYMVRTTSAGYAEESLQSAQMSWYPQHHAWSAENSKWGQTDYLTHEAEKILNTHRALLESSSQMRLCFSAKEWSRKIGSPSNGTHVTGRLYSSANEATLQYLCQS